MSQVSDDSSLHHRSEISLEPIQELNAQSENQSSHECSEVFHRDQGPGAFELDIQSITKFNREGSYR